MLKLPWRKRRTLAVAESCTGGLLGHWLTETPGASEHFLGGVIAYHDRVKETLLGVPKRLLREHGAVSAPVARKMAEGVRAAFKADVGMAITGIAGPSGGTKKKPVGRVYLALSEGRCTVCKKMTFSGARSDVKAQAAGAALNWLKQRLPEIPRT